VFLAAVEAKLFTLAVIGVLCSAVAAFYYWRIIKVMYFDDAAPAFDKPSLTLRAVLAVSAVSMLLYWVYPAPLVQAAESAAKSLF
jgi:NADH-quinone oxidoreductase subunit N